MDFQISMLVECEKESAYVGWIEVRGPGRSTALYSYSVKYAPQQPHLVDCRSICLDSELLRILEPIRNENIFTEKFRGFKEPYILAQDFQSLINELASLTSISKTKNLRGKSASSDFTNNYNAAADKSFGIYTYLHETERGLSVVLLSHIAEIGWKHVESTNADMSSLTLSVIDSRQRKHVFEVKLDTSISGYPWTSPEVHAELPVAVTLTNWPMQSPHGGNLKIVLSAVLVEAERYSDLLDILQDLDTHCCVLEPSKATFAVCRRRIALERTCSMYIDFPDPVRNPYAMCSIRFLGPPDKLAAYQTSLQANIHSWQSSLDHSRGQTRTEGAAGESAGLSAEKDLSKQHTSLICSGRGSLVRENLQRMLGMVLPKPRDSQRDEGQPVKRRKTAVSTNKADEFDDDYVTECGVCYSLAAPTSHTHEGLLTDDDGILPELVCPNFRCRKMYHPRCLLEWLQAVPSSRMSFGTVFGSCPYCFEQLSVSSLV